MKLKLNYRTNLFALTLVFMLSFNAQAHESRPLYFEINETSQNMYTVTSKIPPSIPNFNNPKLILPVGCTEKSLGSKQLYQCSNEIAGREMRVEFSQFKPAVSTLIRLNRLSNEKYSVLLGPKESVWTIPNKETRVGVAKQYTVLGIGHILGGIDHLLFLVGLLLIARKRKRILIAITGFTIAHSLTLILSALEVVRVPVAPVEAIIALSIVFVATEIARGNKETITYRYPIAVSSSFGLLHGFGFSAVLNEIGLPQTELLTGLLFFNVGVEIGQLLFVGGIVALMIGLQNVSKIKIEHIFKFERSIAYALGILATYWMYERIYNFI